MFDPHSADFALDEMPGSEPRNEPLWAYLSYRPTIGGAKNAT